MSCLRYVATATPRQIEQCRGAATTAARANAAARNERHRTARPRARSLIQRCPMPIGAEWKRWPCRYLIVVVVVAAMAAGVARRRGQAPSRVRLVFVLEALGLIVVGYGLLALMFNG